MKMSREAKWHIGWCRCGTQGCMLCSLAYTRTYQIRIMFLCLVCVSCINKNVAFIYSNQKRSLLSFIVRLTIDMCKLIHVSLQFDGWCFFQDFSLWHLQPMKTILATFNMLRVANKISNFPTALHELSPFVLHCMSFINLTIMLILNSV